MMHLQVLLETRIADGRRRVVWSGGLGVEPYIL